MAAHTNSVEPLLRVQNLSITFRIDRNQQLQAVKEVCFDVRAQSSLALVGESGSGKSVTALAIVGLLPKENARVHEASRVLYAGRDLLRASARAVRQVRGAHIAMVFQDPMTALNPVLTVGDQIVEALRAHLRLAARPARERTQALLDEVGIPDPARRMRDYPHQFSGGQQQRIMLAMAIAAEPKLLIADEPTTALDVSIQRQILELIGKLRERHRMSVLFITHDLTLVQQLADDVVVMRAGEVQEQGPTRTVFATPRHPYTRALLACRPRLDRKLARLPVIEDFLNASSATVIAPEAVARVPASSTQMPVLEVRALSKRYLIADGLLRKRAFHAVEGVSFKLAKGRTVGLVGESGSGKSTLGLCVLRLLRFEAGEILLDGEDVSRLEAAAFLRYRRRVQIVFQNPYAALNQRFSIAQTLLEPMQLHAIGASDDERLALAVELLRKVGMDADALGKFPHEFSGGQRQRIAIARCLCLRPEVLVCDECVSALDVSVQAQVLNLLRDLQSDYALSYLFISHDLAVVRHMADHVLVMHAGKIVESGSADAVFDAPAHPYTRELLAAARL